MSEINRLPKFESKLDLQAITSETNKYFTSWLIDRLREEDEFDAAWDKRDEEVADLEKLWKL